MDSNDFDVDAFLERPLTARLASVGPHGPAVRAIWYLWEHGSFWWLTGPWSALAAQLDKDPRVALIVDVCDLAGGDVKQVLARGRAALHPYDANRARRKLARYLGDDQSTWDRSRFNPEEPPRPGTQFVELQPERLTAKDLSYRPSPSAPRAS
jgi:nitroimidazol reductase NimA-like FMN-containing flavoprotein (pyridoxamine 5'-phosphate oxidase superfamily)